MISALRTPFAIAVLTCLAVCGEAKAEQDQQHYQRAIATNSSSPYFVEVTVTNEATGISFTGCVTANSLVGAIFRELGGPADPATDRSITQQAYAIALNSTDHNFHFSNHEAYVSLRRQYDEDELAEARKAVKSLGLKAMALPTNTPERQSLGKLQRSANLACAIIEEGGSARRADITSEVYAEP